jgi:CHASE2 domain-containing sensor protein
MRKYFFNRDTLLATLMVFIVIGLLALVPVNTHVFDPVKLALQDFDYNDLAWSKMNKNKTTSIDTNIFIVNIGDADRPAIAAIINKVQQQKPKVCGVDVIFDQRRSAAEDSLLVSVSGAPGVVMAYQLDVHGHEAAPRGFLNERSPRKGYVNFVGEKGGVIRNFSPFVHAGNEEYESFAASVAKLVDPSAYERVRDRNNKTETIQYTRREEQFQVINGNDFLAGTDSISLTGKIVLVGYLSEKPTDVEDKHFTPMNDASFGKSIPDMHGIVVHANIISMILSGNYINKMPVWITWLLALVLGWIHMAVFMHYFIERHLWFHLVAKLAQLVSSVFFIYIGLEVLCKWDYKVNLVPSFLAIILAVDVLYFYEAICNWLNRKYRLHTVFHNRKH